MICLLVTSNLSIRSSSAGCGDAVNNVYGYRLFILWRFFLQYISRSHHYFITFIIILITRIIQTPLQLVCMVHKLDIPGSERCEENYATRPAAAARMKLDDHPCPFKAS